MYSFRLNDANVFCTEVEEIIDKQISLDKRSKMYAFMSETNELLGDDDSTNIKTTCRFSYPFYKRNNSGQLDFSIEYLKKQVDSNSSTELSKNSTEKQYKIEIIIGIYKPEGGNIDTNYQEKTLSKLEETLVKDFLEDTKSSNILAVKNIYKHKGKYCKEFNTGCWVSAVKYTVPNNKGYKNYKTEIQPLISTFIKMIQDI